MTTQTTQELFMSHEAKKLMDQFGTKSFSDRKLQLFWKELKDLPYQVITKIIDDLIGSCRFSPTMVELSEKISIHREIDHEKSKRKQFHDLNRNFKPEEQKKVLSAILECLTKGDLVRLDNIAKKITPSLRSCLKCGGDGIATAIDEKKYEYAFRCDCQAGREALEAWPIWGGKSSMGLRLKFGGMV